MSHFDTRNFRVGMVLEFRAHVPWWLRFWRWLTRYQPPVISKIDHETNTIYIGPLGEEPDETWETIEL